MSSYKIGDGGLPPWWGGWFKPSLVLKCCVRRKKIGNGIEAIATTAHVIFATTITRFGMNTPAQSFERCKFELNTKIDAKRFRCIGARIVRIATCMERHIETKHVAWRPFLLQTWQGF